MGFDARSQRKLRSVVSMAGGRPVCDGTVVMLVDVFAVYDAVRLVTEFPESPC